METFGEYRLHHVGILFPDMEAAENFLVLMDLKETYRGFVEKWCCWGIFTQARTGAAIELVVAEGGPLARFNKGLGGVHHFAYEVESMPAAEAWCARKQLKLLEPAPLKGAGNFICNFINPLYTRGIQIELVQPL